MRSPPFLPFFALFFFSLESRSIQEIQLLLLVPTSTLREISHRKTTTFSSCPTPPSLRHLSTRSPQPSSSSAMASPLKLSTFISFFLSYVPSLSSDSSSFAVSARSSLVTHGGSGPLLRPSSVRPSLSPPSLSILIPPHSLFYILTEIRHGSDHQTWHQQGSFRPSLSKEPNGSERRKKEEE